METRVRYSPLVIIFLTIGFLVLGYTLWAYLFESDNYKEACTLEAKICPDGSAVGRAGSNCEFAECPK